MMNLVILAAVVAASATVALAHEGHEHATGVVRERMELMTSMGEHLLAISKRLRANKDFGGVTDDARAIEQLAKKIPLQFPVGSTQFPTAAKPQIWQERADFDARAKKLETEAEKLMQANPSDGPALRSQFRAIAYTCDGCHEMYRATK
jgi:cytochrome c556